MQTKWPVGCPQIAVSRLHRNPNCGLAHASLWKQISEIKILFASQTNDFRPTHPQFSPIRSRLQELMFRMELCVAPPRTFYAQLLMIISREVSGPHAHSPSPRRSRTSSCTLPKLTTSCGVNLWIASLSMIFSTNNTSLARGHHERATRLPRISPVNIFNNILECNQEV